MLRNVSNNRPCRLPLPVEPVGSSIYQQLCHARRPVSQRVLDSWNFHSAKEAVTKLCICGLVGVALMQKNHCPGYECPGKATSVIGFILHGLAETNGLPISKYATLLIIDVVPSP